MNDTGNGGGLHRGQAESGVVLGVKTKGKSNNDLRQAGRCQGGWWHFFNKSATLGKWWRSNRRYLRI